MLSCDGSEVCGIWIDGVDEGNLFGNGVGFWIAIGESVGDDDGILFGQDVGRLVGSGVGWMEGFDVGKAV